MRVVTFRRSDGSSGVGRINGEEIAVLEAPSMLDWLSSDEIGESGEVVALNEATLLAPVPRPPSVRDFYAFEGHVRAGWRRRGGEIPAAWYQAPAFYFSNPASIHGPGETVQRPAATRMLDFELELAAIVGADGAIAGFTLMNDWSARDVQREEMTVGLGPTKGKDFATSMGPWLVTPDELPMADGRLGIEATVAVNGQEVARSDAAEQHWSWIELVAHAGRDTRLVPGDVIGSGTLTGGCLLELLPFTGGAYLSPGDEVVLEAEGLGSLRSRVE